MVSGRGEVGHVIATEHSHAPTVTFHGEASRLPQPLQHPLLRRRSQAWNPNIHPERLAVGKLEVGLDAVQRRESRQEPACVQIVEAGDVGVVSKQQLDPRTVHRQADLLPHELARLVGCVQGPSQRSADDSQQCNGEVRLYSEPPGRQSLNQADGEKPC